MNLGAVVQNLTGISDQLGNVSLSWSGISVLTITYLTNGSFAQPDPQVTQIEVKALGGGAGGAACWYVAGLNNGTAGQGGAYADAFFAPSALAYPVAITVGAAGVGGPFGNSGPVYGTSGGVTSFGSYIVANGGSAVANQPAATASVTGAASYSTENGGITVTGDVQPPSTVYAGAAGGEAIPGGFNSPPVAGGVAIGGGPGGNGGNAPDGSTATTVAQCNGGNATNYGAGGGGAALHNSSIFGTSGGNGTQGICIIAQTYPAATGYDVYRDGVYIGTTASTSFVDSPGSGSFTYKVVAIVNNAEASQAGETVVVTVSVPPAAAYGRFVGSAVYPAVQVSRVGDIKPRIWPAKKNNTVQA